MSEAGEGFNVRKTASASSKPLYRLYVQRAELFGLSPFWSLHRTLLARVLAPGRLLGTLISQAPNLPGSSQGFRLFFDGFGHSRAPEAATSAMRSIFFSLSHFSDPDHSFCLFGMILHASTVLYQLSQGKPYNRVPRDENVSA